MTTRDQPFHPEVDTSEVEFGSEVSNRPESDSPKRPPVTGRIGRDEAGMEESGGGSGGKQAQGSGRYGEEFVFTRLVETVRREGSAPLVEWHWTPQQIDTSKNIPDGDERHPNSTLPVEGYNKSAPGVELTISGQTVRVLHVRDLQLGADILVEGMGFKPNRSRETIVEPLEPSPDARAWIEVKSSQDVQSQVTMTLPEYGRAREQQENYHVIPVNNNGSSEIFTDPPLSDLGKLNEAGRIRVRGDGVTVHYR